jgi:NIMA (never in mitosis gene a)-related kinase
MSLMEKEKRNALNEIRILTSIDHPNIIKYKGAFFSESGQDLCIVMELAPRKDLATRITHNRKSNLAFPEQKIWTLGRDVVRGLSLLHSKNILHRDIKPANIFLGEGDVAKIGDFNVSVLLKAGRLALMQIGTPYYASP